MPVAESFRIELSPIAFYSRLSQKSEQQHTTIETWNFVWLENHFTEY